MRRLAVISLAVVLALSLSIIPLPSQPAMAGGVFNVPSSTYPTIQAGIDAAFGAEGGVVLVAAGNYSENIQLKSGVDVVSGNRTANTTISGTGGAPVVTANEVINAKLDGFTIANGSGTQLGAGVAIQQNSANVTISNCVITGNTATIFGGGIIVQGNSSPVIVNCTIVGNTANQLPTTPPIGGNGGGIYITNSSPIITNCITANNTALNAGGGIYVDNSPSANITYNDVRNNTAAVTGTENYGGITDQTDTNGNISQDPQFVGAGDYHLNAGSPCIDAGDNNAANLPDTDKDGKDRKINDRVDMGAYEYGEAAPQNQSPVADAGPDATYTLEVSQPTINVTLNGSNSTDSDGTIVAYTWAGTPDPDDIANPIVTLGAGAHTFTLVVTDDDDATSESDNVTITVNETPNQPPVADAYTIKSRTIDKLEEAKAGGRRVDRAIDGVIRNINRSLKEKYWDDNSHLVAKYGSKVFLYERMAVGKMKLYIKFWEKRGPTPEQQQAINAFEEVIPELVQADQLLAEIALDEAHDTSPPENHKKLKRYQRAL
ncbi:choice-of-anchor Q domain-containing protein, partial [Chloroflexota bacterium]